MAEDTQVTPTPTESGQSLEVTQATTPPQTEAPKTEEPSWLKSRLERQATQLKSDFDKQLTDERAKWEAGIADTMKTAIETDRQAQALVAAKNSLVEEFGLTEEQAAVLNGSDAEQLRKSAETLFGALRKPLTPKLNAGNDNTATGPLDVNKMQTADFRNNDTFGKLLKQATQR